MPRSVRHELSGELAGLQVRAWRTSDGHMHLICEGRVAHPQHGPLDVDVVWDVPPSQAGWHGRVAAVRSGDAAAAQQLGRVSVDEAVARAGW